MWRNIEIFDFHSDLLRLHPISLMENEGILSRDALRQKILGKEVMLCTIKDKQGKYGRYLAIVYMGTLSINSWLVENGFAKDGNY